MNTALAKRLLTEIGEKQLCRAVTLYCMGEPLIHPDVFDIVEHGQNAGVRIIVNTNATLLDDEKIDRVFRSGLSRLIFSLQTPSAEYFHLKRTSAFSHEGVVGNIEKTIKEKFRRKADTAIEIHLLSTRLERPGGHAVMESFSDYRHACRPWLDMARDVEKEFGVAAIPHSRWSLRKLYMGMVDRIEILPDVHILVKRATLWANSLIGTHGRIEPTDSGGCHFPTDTFVVFWDGRCSICCLDYDANLVVGNVNDGSIEDILASERYRELVDSFREHRLTESFCQNCQGHLVATGDVRLVNRSLSLLIGSGLTHIKKHGFGESARRLPREVRRYFGH